MATESMIGYGIVDWSPEGQPSIDAVLAIARSEPVPAPCRIETRTATLPAKACPAGGSRAGASAGARAAEAGPKPGSSVMVVAEAAEIPERSLIVAADALGARTQRGQWWLPG